jgi:hypothetical protein
LTLTLVFRDVQFTPERRERVGLCS